MIIMHPVYDLTRSRADGVTAVAEDKPYPPGISLDNSCNLQAALAGLLEHESPSRFVDAINTANGALGNRAFLRYVGELHATRKQHAIHDVAGWCRQGRRSL